MGTGRNMGIIVTAWREALLASAQEVTPDHLLTALAVSGALPPSCWPATA